MRRALLLTLLVLGGCGSADDDGAKSDGSNPVAVSSAKTVRAGAVRYEMHGKIGIPGAPGGAFPVRGSGTVDGRAFMGRTSFTMDIPRVGQTKVEQILDGRRMFMSSPEFEAITGVKKWVMLELDRADQAAGVDFGTLTSQSAVDPNELLDYLRQAKSVKPKGTETIRGELSKRYAAELNLIDIAERRKGDRVRHSKAEALLRQAGGERLPVTVFVGPGDLVRRLVLEFGEGDDAFRFTIDYIEYGMKLVRKVPPAAQVMDIGELGAAASGLGG